MTQMAQIETGIEAKMSNPSNNSPKKAQQEVKQAANPDNLPMVIEPTRARPSLHINRIPAQFLSQLIAERNHMAIQRNRRRAPVSLATRAYNSTTRIAIARMPNGFNYQSKA